MLIYKMKSGEKVFRQDDTIIVKLAGLRRVISTAWVNGGHKEDLQAIFNHSLPPNYHNPEDLEGGSVEAYLKIQTGRLGLPEHFTTGFLTAASMENVAIKTASFRELEVTSIVTGGVDVNGGRAGDPAPHYELDGNWNNLKGTINIILLIDGNLLPPVLIRSIVTATEAKTAALAELMAPSRYSQGIATGSGTDQIIAVSNSESPYCFTDAGKHSKLGELIGVTVKEAVKLALEKQTGLNPKRQRSVLARLERYGITAEDFWHWAEQDWFKPKREAYMKYFQQLDKDEKLVALTAGVVHLLDEYEWGLLSGETIINTGIRFIQSFFAEQGFIHEQASDPVPCLGRVLMQAVNKIILEKIS